MQVNLKTAAYLLVLGALTFAAVIGVTQAGPLDPPGPPAPTMKTLQEVEPRTPISSLPYTISTGGSYYLTASLTCTACTAGQDGITIGSNNVTLDLMGFTITGVGGSGDGIRATAIFINLVIRNGTVRDWSGDGIDLASTTQNVRLEDLQVYSNSGDGVRIGFHTIVENLLSRSNNGDGIEVTGRENTVRGGVFSVNDGAGIHIVTPTGDTNRVEANEVSFNGTGIDVDVAGNLIIRNGASGNTTNYDIVPGNFVGTIVTTEAAMNAAANSNVNIDY